MANRKIKNLSTKKLQPLSVNELNNVVGGDGVAPPATGFVVNGVNLRNAKRIKIKYNDGFDNGPTGYEVISYQDSK